MATATQRLVTEDALAKTRLISASGVPNGVIAAMPGSTYVDAAKTWDASAWIKTSGTGNTGWEVVRAAAVARSLIALSTTPVTSGDVRYSRTVAGVTLAIDGIKPTADGTLTLFSNNALESIAPPPGIQAEFRLGVGNSEATRRAKIDQYGVITIYSAKATDVLYGSVHYNTTRAWSAPMGTAVVA